MAAASLDVNFKEELSAIEQCKLIKYNLRTHLTPVKGSVSSPKQSAPQLCIVSFNILLRFKSVSSSPSFNKWHAQIP